VGEGDGRHRRRLEVLRGRVEEMATDLAALVEVESPSADPAALAACADAVAELGGRLLGTRPERVEREGRPHLRWSFGDPPRVLLLAHLDTVWPLGTLGRWPVERDGDRLTGPGAFDTKAGIVQALHALQALQEQGSVGVELLVNSDEEVGSPTSSELIEAASRQARAVLVLEPSQGGTGALKTARKGFAVFRLRVHGRAAHAGNQPELGVNALVELARQVTAVEGLGRPGQGTTVTPTLAWAGTTSNTVPAQAELHLDVRFLDPGEYERVARDLRALAPELPGARLELLQGPSSPPLPPAASRWLYPVARRLGEALGLGLIDGVAVGGGSDGNRAAAAGAPVLDGLGAVGDHIHAEGEYVVVPAMAERAALLAALVEECPERDGRPGGGG
jgi:glutamate carboxypeptidase